MLQFLAAGCLAITIILIEWMLWKLFSGRIEGYEFPRESDESVFRFFSMRRLRALFIAHVIFLLVVTEYLLFLLW